MSALAQRMRARRESRVEVGGFGFQLRLPTALQCMQAANAADLALSAVVGWDGVRLSDLLPGEPDEPAPFEADACREWLAERLDLLGPLIEELSRLRDARKAEIEGAEKN